MSYCEFCIVQEKRLQVYEEIFGNTRIPTVQDALEKELEFIGQEFTATLINHYKKATLQRLHNHKNVPEEEIRELHFSLRQRLVSDLRHHEVLIRKPKLLNEATKILYYESSEYLDRTLQARRFYHALEQIKNNEQKMQVAMAKDDSGSFLDTVLQPIIPFISLGAAFCCFIFSTGSSPACIKYVPENRLQRVFDNRYNCQLTYY
ncbi:uncharacterized protein LOC129587008 [Paramacrobiotus metropolitanus]|uniref:uncharacterized protein LOC129587008 n=1 Tax=Paramacrobiotus metropolitanus TaxID=2943436 RepID=UPI0024458A24|nr:uncharacterized protein LOC129587008 [Paramacrobiotus metropolitanus]